MTKLGSELKKPGEWDISALIDYGCITVIQCALMAVVTNVRGYFENKHIEAVGHYMSLAYLDIMDGRLSAKHPLTHIPYSEYLRMNKAGMFGFDGCGIQNPTWDWLIPLDEAERWLQSKGLDIDLEAFRMKVRGPSGQSRPNLAPTVESVPASASNLLDWRVQARIIADECFDTDTRNGCRSSLENYSSRVMEEMQKRDIRGPRGIIDNAKTVMRDALQGKKWWATKQK